MQIAYSYLVKKTIYILLFLTLTSCLIESLDDCSISDLEVAVGECNADGTYNLTLNFAYENPGNDYFEVYVRDDVFIDYYELSELPLTIENFEMSGLEYDYIEVCINDVADCCQAIEWESPQCDSDDDCSISDLEVAVGECNADGTYNLTLNFAYENPGNDYFEVFIRDDVFIDYYELSELPLTIENFEMSGLEYDYIEVCINDVVDCCQEIEWESPQCDSDDDCSISDLEVAVGECNADGTYNLTLNFAYENPGNDYFEVFIRDDVFIDYYELSELPLTIENFEMSGLEYDYIEVCINDVADCCQAIEWESPDC